MKDLKDFHFFLKSPFIVSNIYKFHMKFKLIGLVICISSLKFQLIGKYGFVNKIYQMEFGGDLDDIL